MKTIIQITTITVVLSLNMLFGIQSAYSASIGYVSKLLPKTETYSLNSNNDDLYLPLITNNDWGSLERRVPTVHVPYFQDDIDFEQTAIFWFGNVTPIDNYADVRIGYTSQFLYIRLGVFDRLLWYDTQPTSDTLQSWDAAELYVKVNTIGSDIIDQYTYRFVGQLNWWEDREQWQTSYQGNGIGWDEKALSFTTISGWRGNAPNDNVNDRGWTLVYKIPYTSLGLSGPPINGERWKIAIDLHDRDDISGSPISTKSWPDSMITNDPLTWGYLSFGYPKNDSNIASPDGQVTIRHKLNGAQVVDAHVGGDTTCGQDYSPSFFDGWGDANYAYDEQINIQNQSDVADWPCFSKFYVTFPLELVPNGKEILSATLRLYQFGNSGQGWEPAPQPSFIQIGIASNQWVESTITWNNAPYLLENHGGTWVYPLTEFPDYPGVLVEWNISTAVANAYARGEPIRLVLYSADSAIHSGKYFFSSDIDEWNAEGRPTLEVVWGD